MTPRADVCSKQLIKRAAAAPEDKRVHDIITGQKGSAGLCSPPLVGMISEIRVKRIWFLCNQCFLDSVFLVICNFRSPICQALVLEIGETVQILEKSEGETRDRKCGSEGRYFQLCCVLYGNFPCFSCCGSLLSQS